MVSLLAPWGVSAEDTTGGFTCLLWTFVTFFFGPVPASLLVLAVCLYQHGFGLGRLEQLSKLCFLEPCWGSGDIHDVS